ncbi:MAG TPA: PRTRC system ParB family protein, partial [Burkholderiaceae bacterium]|nr:PRTRC system ParB family protein [Burkholderiaceae bacterium]
METLHLSRLRPGPNPRTFFDPVSMQELIDSVRQRGVLQPIIVRPLPESDDFQIIAGERRYRAAQEAFNGDYEVPVVIKDVGDEEADSIALTENCIRDDMGIVAEAIAAQKLVLRNSGDKDEAARSLGWSREKLDRRLAILHCVKEVRQALDERRIQIGHGELLATLPPERQAPILEKVVAHNVTVAELKTQLAQFSQTLADAIFDQAAAGCATCVHNSTRQASLFAEHLATGRCTHPAHYAEMTEAALAAKAAALQEAVPMVRVIRPTDAFVRIRIVADGDGAVGEEQAQACRGCANFGCAVSALPGSLGVVHEDTCFNLACHTVKRAQHLKALQAARVAEQGAAAAVAGTTKTAQAGSAAKTAATPPASAASSAAVTRGVAEYRVAQWRQMLATTLAADRALAQRFLLAVVAGGNARWLDADALG